MRVIVTGSHGLIGSALVSALAAGGHQVTRLVRSAPKPGEVRWDPQADSVDATGLEGHDAVVHLAGAGIGDRRWTPSYKAQVLESRVQGTTLLAKTLASLDQPPGVLASASAVGWYGDRSDEALTEASSPGTGFLAEVCKLWEASTAAAEEAGIRVVHLRTGIVLSSHGGTLARLLLPFRLGIGGRIGSGRQWLSWIGLDDEVGAILHVLDRPEPRGPVNLTAPQPVTNAEFTKTLGRVLRRPTVVPVPTLALRALFGSEMVQEVILGGQRVLPTVLQATGYRFRRVELEPALRALLS